MRALFELTGWTDQEYLAALQSKSLVVAPKRTALGVSFLPFDQQVDRVGICSFWYLGHNMCTINSNNLGCPGDDGRMVRCLKQLLSEISHEYSTVWYNT